MWQEGNGGVAYELEQKEGPVGALAWLSVNSVNGFLQGVPTQAVSWSLSSVKLDCPILYCHTPFSPDDLSNLCLS